MGRGRGKWKIGQQLCRKVCNSVKDSCKSTVYKGFRDWFHGLFGHETREGIRMEIGRGKGRRRRGERGRFRRVFGLVGRATGKKYNL